MTILNNPAIKQIHCMGIGGIGLSGLAEILLMKGYRVTGSDVANNPLIERLQKLGAKISLNHQPQNVAGADALVYTSMISPQNPEFMEAKRLGIPMIRRGELLAEVMQGKENIIVAGTHGKTTTTSLIAYVLMQHGLDPNFAIGGVINHLESTARLGKSQYFVAESDESDGSFLFLSPKFGVVTNIDKDHLEYYGGDFEVLKKSFLKFLQKIPKDGYAILNWDDPRIREIAKDLSCRIIKTGFSDDADVRGEQYHQQGLQSTFIAKRPSGSISIKLNLPGRHNVNNALAVIALAELLNIPDEVLTRALAGFPGVKRRFYFHGEVPIKDGAISVFDDYGHHPNEIKATIDAVRLAWPSRRFVMVFQPHRYTRTRDLLSDFASVLSLPDQLVLLEIYSAGEAEISGVNGKALCQAIVKTGGQSPIFVSKIEDLTQVLTQILLPNDVVFFQGAGSVGALAKTVSQYFLT